ncbi:hypothetical protein [Microcoleus sp. FACHB-831]|uniref:hypothetical protein n=1 Tax=Microcoleus sp. FACHB-831 TaxID=2692827 RepID=UPI001684CE00|nr:hypothetical protein [Microcoleus sp. FACHB-831]
MAYQKPRSPNYSIAVLRDIPTLRSPLPVKRSNHATYFCLEQLWREALLIWGMIFNFA